MVVSRRVALLSLAACAGFAAADPVPHTGATAAWGDQTVAPASTTTAADVTFREHVLRFATTTGRHVAAWGTLRLDGAHPHRFATLLPDADGRGAYVVELAPAERVQVLTFDVDGRTVAFGGDEDTRAGAPGTVAPVPWNARPETALPHSAGHHRGGEDFALSLDGAALVLDRYRYVDDVRSPTRGDADHTFRTGGVCKPRCPTAAAQSYKDSGLAFGPVTAFTAPLAEPK